nr:hypothetical protein [Microbispora cellulosiformans]
MAEVPVLTGDAAEELDSPWPRWACCVSALIKRRARRAASFV